MCFYRKLTWFFSHFPSDYFSRRIRRCTKREREPVSSSQVNSWPTNRKGTVEGNIFAFPQNHSRNHGWGKVMAREMRGEHLFFAGRLTLPLISRLSVKFLSRELLAHEFDCTVVCLSMNNRNPWLSLHSHPHCIPCFRSPRGICLAILQDRQEMRWCETFFPFCRGNRTSGLLSRFREPCSQKTDNTTPTPHEAKRTTKKRTRGWCCFFVDDIIDSHTTFW